MRIAHATDVHWFVPPRPGQMVFKRWVGSANLYLRGRRLDFDEAVQTALVAHLRQLVPDLVVITGDLTCQASTEEFEKARAALAPLLDQLPTMVIPGNHDVYTDEAAREDFHGRFFGPWWRAEGQVVARRDVGSVTVVGLDPNRPTWVTAAGVVPDDQLAALASTLADPWLRDRRVVLAIHYPPVDRRGAIYDRPMHGLRNARALIEVLDAAPVRPSLILCGHVHRGFRSELRLTDGATVPVLNCGSSGHAFDIVRRRAAATACYTFAEDGTVHADRWIHDGQRFAPEPGGAFASGR